MLQFNRQESIQVKEDKGITFKQDTHHRFVDYVIRQNFTCTLEGDVLYTPFEVINLYLSATVQSVALEPKNNGGKRIEIKFNCMDTKKTKIIDSSSTCYFGNYTLAKYYLSSRFKNS